ncbi:hypothetical protein [Halorussus sp. MSC15.2]|uniref:hypothetical protein n=1 Tax=Halorussus sp. MSC15.2 TaxID=2283638 RepID=UPI0013D4FAC0|nr:hypothetical protein [Halorussus sp. MSC15.2]NEU57801.1 hypothetical protein [Halorussus sp. MSC15.2]
MTDVTIYLSQKAYNKLGTEPLDIAYNYLEHAFNDLSTSYTLEKGGTFFDATYDYNGDGTTGSDTCVDLDDFGAFVSDQSDSGSKANHVLTYGDWTCNPASDGYLSWSSDAEDVAQLSKDPVDSHEDTTTGAHAITGVLHEVGHSLLVPESEMQTGDSHKTGSNRLEFYSGLNFTGYYVTPMLTNYDRQFVGEDNECGEHIDDPEDGDAIYLEHLYSNCFDKHTE